MARIVNDISAPIPIMKYAESQLYEPQKGVYRVTEIISPPLARTLCLNHWDKIVMRLSSLLPAMEGTAWHSKMELFAPESAITKTRYTKQYKDVFITGEPDIYVPDEGWLGDYKLSSVWHWILDNNWPEQLNIYRWLMNGGHKCGDLFNPVDLPVKKMSIFASFKDWSERDLQRATRKYPPARYVTVPIDVWPNSQTQGYIDERMTDHLEHPDRECTDKEKWNKSVRCRSWCPAGCVCPYNPFRDNNY